MEKIDMTKQPNRMHFAALADKKTPRIKPPESLNEAQKAIWRQTVDALPSDWFAAEQTPLLAAYCGHVARLAQIEVALAPLDPLSDLVAFDKLAKLAAGESAKIAMHARSMRLTQQSRLKAETASSRGLGAASADRVGAAPWEFGQPDVSEYFS
jgi:hypothetical protein